MSQTSLWVSLVFLAQLAGGVLAAEPDSARRERVESGLRPAIVIAGEPTERFNLVDRMRFYKVPGVSIAVIKDGEIAWVQAYGVREAGTQTPLAIDSQFQAASISKPVAAMVALRMVEQGTLNLDEDVNLKLRSWKLPENEFTTKKKVTLRWLLSHRSGLADYAGFREAAPDRPRPTLKDILETGRWTPAPIRVAFEPDSQFAYSGGGYCLAEQLLEDVSGKPFPHLARELVLTPAEMADSSFDPELLPDRKGRAAVGHQWNGKKLPQHWNDYPATSAAGLWTTPSDLARWMVKLLQAEAGDRSLLSPAMAREMLSLQGRSSLRDSKVIAAREGIPVEPPAAWGLGLGLIGSPPRRFFHSGSNPGYQCELHGCPKSFHGAVIMTNSDQGWRLAREILWAIAQEYGWLDCEYCPESKTVAPLSEPQLERFVGRYQMSLSPPDRWTLEITRDGQRLLARILDFSDKVRLYPESTETCFTIEDAMTLTFVKDKAGRFTEIVSDLGWRAKRSAGRTE